MPSESQAQNRFMHAAAEGKIAGVSPSVGKDFIAADAGRKISSLPEHVKQKAKKLHAKGAISDAHMQKLGLS